MSISSILSAVFKAMYASGPLQWLGAFLWGAASVLLSPCGLAAVPLVVGYIENTDSPTRWEAFKISCAFSAGVVLNLALVGLVTSSVGLLLGGYERILTLLVAVVFIVMGLKLLGLLRLRFLSLGGGSAQAPRPEGHKLRGAVVLGILSGLAIGPCSIAYVTPVLSLAMSQASRGLGISLGLVLAYALGYSAVLVLAGTCAQLASKWLQSERGDKALKALNAVCGLLLIAAGLYLIHSLLALPLLRTGPCGAGSSIEARSSMGFVSVWPPIELPSAGAVLQTAFL